MKKKAEQLAEKKADEMKARAHAFASRAYSSALKTFYESDGAAAEFASFGDYLARVVMHPQTPPALKSALQAVIVNTISNNTACQWADDGADLRFLIPLFLSHMDDAYAAGIVHSTAEFIADTLPEASRLEIRKGDAR